MILAWAALQVALYLFGRRFRDRPFHTTCAGVPLIVRPADKAIRCLVSPTPDQLVEIAAWASSWKRVLKSRPFVVLG